MSYTVQNCIDDTREIMNATGSGQWTDTALRAWDGLAHWQLWGDLLSTNRYLKFQQVTVTQDSNGQFPLSSLTTGTTDSTKYWFRILAIAQPASPGAQVQYFYRQSRFEDFPNPQPNTSLPYVWYRIGDNVQILPVAAGISLSVSLNYRPPNPAQLASTSSTIDFPVGYEPLIAWRAAQLALVKGGSETQAAADIKATADRMESLMKEDLGRESRWPIVAEAFDVPGDWGGTMG
jgi:hypothetical protein